MRPFTAKEQALQSLNIVRTDKDIAWLTDAKGHETMFKYTHCFNSADPDAEDYAEQKDVYDMVGPTILDNVFNGFNACLLAYGQTGVHTNTRVKHKGIRLKFIFCAPTRD